MYFDKIKKVAKDAIRTVSSKVEEKLLRTEDEEDMIELKSAPDMYDEIDDFSEDADYMGETRRFDMKDALSRFKKHKDELEETLSDIMGGSDSKPDKDADVNDFIESNFTDLKKDISESISDIDSDISDLSANYSREMTRINADIKVLSESIRKTAEITQKNNSSIATLSDNLESAIMDINKKLSAISSSISSVNKINDSIFDLKNSQINTKNVLGELDVSFGRLRKKMNAGVTILSIISAIVVVLEVINLLS
ncbi:MAG: hypothetical protein IJC09_05405 [Clostridia bacterium]|nr:hypothetical protein [Clostridia bacterium]